ncbi:ATP-binding protein [Frigidibacter sp. MR17.24]|uniref:ATP-binding protein n=1 Tax=Frigidibacter sp. MR17.24 TaxID=3127345 RepID=UPI0030131E17
MARTPEPVTWNGPVRICAHADVGAVRQLLGLVVHRASSVMNPVAAETAQLVIAEVLNNIVEHAYAGRGGPVVLRMRHSAGVMVVSISDCGRELPLQVLTRGDGPDPRLAEGGFGWPIIHHFARRLSYRRVGRWNRLRFCLPLRLPAG